MMFPDDDVMVAIRCLCCVHYETDAEHVHTSFLDGTWKCQYSRKILCRGHCQITRKYVS